MSDPKLEKVDENTRPPIESGRMVSEEDLKIKEVAQKVRKGEIFELPDEKVLLLFIGEGIYDLNRRMEELLDIFRKAGKTSSQLPNKSQSTSQPKTEVKANQNASPLEIAEGEDRVKQIVSAFERYSDKVTVDIESESMFVVVKPKMYLQDGWAEINVFAKGFDGIWIRQGKEGHWKIPKMVKKSTESVSTPKEEPNREKPKGPPSDVEIVKILFTKKLEDLLTFKVDGTNVIIKPKKFLGTEDFTKTASTVRAAGGEYESAGENSHFIIPIGAK